MRVTRNKFPKSSSDASLQNTDLKRVLATSNTNVRKTSTRHVKSKSISTTNYRLSNVVDIKKVLNKPSSSLIKRNYKTSKKSRDESEKTFNEGFQSDFFSKVKDNNYSVDNTSNEKLYATRYKINKTPKFSLGNQQNIKNLRNVRKIDSTSVENENSRNTKPKMFSSMQNFKPSFIKIDQGSEKTNIEIPDPLSHRTQGSFNNNLHSNQNFSIKDFIGETSDPARFNKIYKRMITEDNCSKFSTKHEEWIEDKLNMLDTNSQCKTDPFELGFLTAKMMKGVGANMDMLNQEKTFTKKDPIKILKNKVLKDLYIPSGEYCVFQVISKEFLYPAKIRVFSDQIKVDVVITASFNLIPDLTSNDFKNSGKCLIIPKKYQFQDCNGFFYISIFAINDVFGHVGVAFKGIDVVSRINQDQNDQIPPLYNMYNILPGLKEELEAEEKEFGYVNFFDYDTKSNVTKLNTNPSLKSFMPHDRSKNKKRPISISNSQKKGNPEQNQPSVSNFNTEAGLLTNRNVPEPVKDVMNVNFLENLESQSTKQNPPNFQTIKNIPSRQNIKSNANNHTLGVSRTSDDSIQKIRINPMFSTRRIVEQMSPIRKKQVLNTIDLIKIESNRNIKNAMDNQGPGKSFHGKFFEAKGNEEEIRMVDEQIEDSSIKNKKTEDFEFEKFTKNVFGRAFGHNKQNSVDGIFSSNQIFNTISRKARSKNDSNKLKSNLFETISSIARNNFEANSLKSALVLLNNPEESKINIHYKTDKEARENQMDKIGQLIVSNTQKKDFKDFEQKNKDHIKLINSNDNFSLSQVEKQSILWQIKKLVADHSHRKIREERINYLTEIQKSNEIKKQKRINEVKEKELKQQKNCVRDFWVLFMLLFKALEIIEEKYEKKMECRMERTIRLLYRKRLQKKFRKKIAPNLTSKPTKLTENIISLSLRLFADMSKKRSEEINSKILGRLLSRFVKLTIIKNKLLDYVETRRILALRVMRHKTSVIQNYNIFQKEFDREMMKLMTFQDYVSMDKFRKTDLIKDVDIDVSTHLPNFHTKFRKNLFEIWYNVKLISHLQKRYVNKKLAENKDAKNQLEGFCVSSIRKSADVSKTVSRRNSLELPKINVKLDDNLLSHSNREIDTNEPLKIEVKSPFKLDEIMLFTTSINALKNHKYISIYIETLKRWEEGYYNKLFATIVEVDAQKSITKSNRLFGGITNFRNFLLKKTFF